eukprot:g2546.t1
MAKSARMRRQKRRRERRKATLLVKLQAWCRGRLVLMRLRKKFRADWKRKVADVVRLQEFLAKTGVAFEPPADTIFILLREYNFFAKYERHDDYKVEEEDKKVSSRDRAASEDDDEERDRNRMLALLWTSFTSRVAANNVLYLLTRDGDARVLPWRLQMTRFFRNICSSLGSDESVGRFATIFFDRVGGDAKAKGGIPIVSTTALGSSVEVREIRRILMSCSRTIFQETCAAENLAGAKSLLHLSRKVLVPSFYDSVSEWARVFSTFARIAMSSSSSPASSSKSRRNAVRCVMPIVASTWHGHASLVLRSTSFQQQQRSKKATRKVRGGRDDDGDVDASRWLLAAAYSKLLSSLDDGEFFSGGKDGARQPFDHDELRFMVRDLRATLRRLIWNARESEKAFDPDAFDSDDSDLDDETEAAGGVDSDDVSGRKHGWRLVECLKLPPAQHKLLVTCGRLFQELYARHSRQKMFEDSDWHFESLSRSELMSAALTATGSASDCCTKRSVVLLSRIPQVVPFPLRANIFFKVLEQDRSTQDRAPGHGHAIEIRRDHLIEDSVRAFTRMVASGRAGRSGGLKDLLRIEFIDENGRKEPGIDGGGVFKEYMDLLAKHVFDPAFGLFKEADDRCLYPNPGSKVAAGDHLAMFEFLGQVLAKAMYEGMLIEPRFALHFLNKLLGHPNAFDELRTMDKDMYNSVLKLKRYDGSFEDLCLFFEVETEAFGSKTSVELVPGGSKIPVTKANCVEYILRMANYRLNRETARQSRAFLRGLREIIPARWLGMFAPRELQRLIGGSVGKVDVRDMRSHTRLVGGYEDGARHIIKWFWEVVESFTDQDRARLLSFVTSCSRPPLLGFARLNPPFTIQRINIRDDSDRMPSSATCMNLLKLPTYSSREVLRKKLLLCIYETKGFELS